MDRAVYAFGRRVESELEKAGQGKKSKGQAAMAQQQVLARWVGGGRFRDPGQGR